MMNLCGVRPTGKMHIGHYFSVIRPALTMNATVLIAEYHAPGTDEGVISDVVKMLSRFGVKLNNIKRQSSDFDATFYFRLLSIAHIGELNRMTQYQTAKEKDAHLFCYPVLMTADCAGYDQVLVGDDQMQHVRFAADLLTRYNKTFNEDKKIPKPLFCGGRVMSLTDSTKKMSKSEPNGCLFLNDDADAIRHKIKKAVTDEVGLANLITLYQNLTYPEIEIPPMNRELKDLLSGKLVELLTN